MPVRRGQSLFDIAPAIPIVRRNSRERGSDNDP